MKLEPEIAAYTDRVKAWETAAGPAPVDAPGRRVRFRALCKYFEQPLPSGVQTTDTTMAGVPVRLYATPGVDRTSRTSRTSTIVYFHGGGWVVGDLDSHAWVTAGLAEATGALVVSVDYRLAPEHPYPAAFDDAWAVVRAVAAEGARRLVVAGDSAGGNLAAAVALAARDRDGPKLAGQALIYPAIDPALDRPSCQRNADGPMLTREGMAYYWRSYLGAATTTDPYAAPILARDLSGLPPALVTLAAHDPLCDEGRAYAERLRAAGVPVDVREAGGLMHGYLRACFASPEAAAEFAALCAWIRERLRR